MKVGTIGSGMIVGEILKGISEVDGMECEAVYSRVEERGRKLAEQFGVRKVYTDLEKMYADDAIDIIYIASPNSMHYKQAKRALECGKSVICEKPFTVYSKEAKELVELAKKKDLFLIEGITTMYMPNYKIVRENLEKIGEIKLVLSTFCQYSSRYEAFKAGENPNIFNPEFAGGALMDINLYNIYFIVGLFGKPKKIRYYAGKEVNGVDTHGILIMEYPQIICQCTGAKNTWCENSVQILGEQGYIKIPSASNVCDEVIVVTKEEKKTYNLQQKGHWCIEVEKIAQIIKNKDYEECFRRLDLSIQVVEVLEMARESANLNF